MIKFFNYIASIIMILVFGCNIKQKQPESYNLSLLKTIKIDYNNEIDISDQKEISNLKIIMLESKESSLIGDVDNIVFYDDKIFILDRFVTKSLFCFNNQGKFLFKIKRIGRGPGEYTLPEQFIIMNDEISIFDNFGTKKINYDLQGNFINETKTAVRMRNIIQMNENRCLVRPDEYAVEEPIKHNLLITDSNVKTIYDKHIPDITLTESVFSVNKTFSRYNDHILFTYGFNDTIYKYTENDLKRFLYIDFGSNKIPSHIIHTTDQFERNEIFNSENNYVGFIANISENNKYISFDYNYFGERGKRNFVLYDKDLDRHYQIRQLESKEYGCTINFPMLIHDGKFVSVLTSKNYSNISIDEDLQALALYNLQMSP